MQAPSADLHNLRRTNTTLLIPLTIDPAKQRHVLDMLRNNMHTVIRTLEGWIATDLIVTADGTRHPRYDRSQHGEVVHAANA